MRYYDRACQLLCKTILAICSVLMTVLLTSTALQVFSRYILGNSFTWTEECARYCFIWLDMLGAAVLVYSGGHAVVDLVSSKFHGVGKKIYQTIIYFCCGYVGVIFAVFGLQLSKATIRQTSPSLKLPMGLVYGVLPICGVLICFFVINRVLNVWLHKNEEEPQEGVQ